MGRPSRTVSLGTAIGHCCCAVQSSYVARLFSAQERAGQCSASITWRGAAQVCILTAFAACVQARKLVRFPDMPTRHSGTISSGTVTCHHEDAEGSMRLFMWHKDQKAVSHCLTAILQMAQT